MVPQSRRGWATLDISRSRIMSVGRTPNPFLPWALGVPSHTAQYSAELIYFILSKSGSALVSDLFYTNVSSGPPSCGCEHVTYFRAKFLRRLLRPAQSINADELVLTIFNYLVLYFQSLSFFLTEKTTRQHV